MGLVSNEPTSMQGNPTNPGILFRAVDYNTNNADIVTGTSYFEGKAVRGKFVGQVLMETNWMPAGTVNNVVYPTLTFEGNSSVTGGGASAINYYDSLKITIYKRMAVPGGYTPSQTTDIYTRYIVNISNGVGTFATEEWVNRPTTQPCWFDIRYEYKFVVTVHRLTTNAYLDLETLYLQFHTSTSIMAGRQVTYNISAPSADPIPVIDGIAWSIGTDGSGNFSAILSSEYFNGTGASSGLVNTDACKCIYNNVQAAITTRAYGSSTDYDNSVLTDISLTGNTGGYEIAVTGYNFGVTRTEYFYTFVYGYTTPLVV